MPARFTASRGGQPPTQQMKNVIRRYQRFVNRMQMATPDILFKALEPTFDKSQEYCPEDTGALKQSGFLEVRQFRGNPRVELGYGKGGNPFYTVAVHENLEWRHKSPTRAKWLQVALEEDQQEIQNRIIAAYRQQVNQPII